MKSNWAEFVFYWKHRLPILMPTYFSLFGLFNIQLRGQEVGNVSEFDIFYQIQKICEYDVLEGYIGNTLWYLYVKFMGGI